MNAVDTNVLIYARDPRDPTKHQAAKSLLAGLSDGVLLWQVACEYLAASRKLEPLGYAWDQAWQDLSDLRAMWTAVEPKWGVLNRANDLHQKYSLSSWDALIIAACLEAGVNRLYTEDFSGYSTIDGLEIVNPFASP